jgi:precorrin-2/cobalt-factor-2 C20-methyltransferase
MSGRLYGVGVGPGDPELLTLKAARILAEAPVIAWPAPNGGESAARASAAALIPPGREEIALAIPMRPGGEPSEAYDRAAEALAAHLVAGRDAAVLCEGDPLFYGTFIYLAERLAGRFAVTIVPGVSSLSACAAAAGQALARRDAALLVLPATLSDDALEAGLRSADCCVVLKVGRHAPRLSRLLERVGRLDGAILVAHASRKDEIVVPLAEWRGEAPYFSAVLVPDRRAR